MRASAAVHSGQGRRQVGTGQGGATLHRTDDKSIYVYGEFLAQSSECNHTPGCVCACCVFGSSIFEGCFWRDCRQMRRGLLKVV